MNKTEATDNFNKLLIKSMGVVAKHPDEFKIVYNYTHSTESFDVMRKTVKICTLYYVPTPEFFWIYVQFFHKDNTLSILIEDEKTVASIVEFLPDAKLARELREIENLKICSDCLTQNILNTGKTWAF